MSWHEDETVKAAVNAFYEVLMRRSEREEMDNETTGMLVASAADVLIYNVILDLLDPIDRDSAMQALAAHASNVGTMLLQRYPDGPPPINGSTVH